MKMKVLTLSGLILCRFITILFFVVPTFHKGWQKWEKSLPKIKQTPNSAEKH
ncbi:hypothetical protein KsCSTR_09330 [Candidatus Kuenenia stuttgartiensis]|uniref:Uncharacterized protein n=1 Tax=Kuenenia stuttgartiensis TaxID=174633 RepID=Q1PZ10_KUEST|nr:hypothetical protein KsCSTR_09330 [Candidatus Kuenenia stuttgartiensis]CAJ72324.1 unknown protein [Candidatus Kuenenia stuttgartiensis]